jgi:hypothetical protein
LIVGVQLRIEHAQREGRGRHAECCNKGVVVFPKAGQNIGDKLTVLERMSGGDEFISKTLHLGKILRRRRLQFFCVGESNQQIINPSLALGGKHLLEGAPNPGRCLKPMNMRENFFGVKGLKQIRENKLVARDPRCICRIDLHLGRGSVRWISRNVDDLSRRRRVCPIEKTHLHGAPYGGQNLRAPGGVVLTREELTRRSAKAQRRRRR